MLALAVIAATLAAGAQLITPSLIHGEEFPDDVVTGQSWYGLYQTETGAELREHSITVRAAEDPIFDSAGEMTGKEVVFEQPNPEERPLVLLRGIPGLKAGPLPTTFCGYAFLFPGDMRHLSLGKAPHLSLSAVGTAEYSDEMPLNYGPMIHNYKLHANDTSTESGKEITRRQTIVEVEELSNDGRPTLLFAGDLDGDGRTDLLFDLTDHYNVSVMTLFLSTKAKAGEVLGEACRLVLTGC